MEKTYLQYDLGAGAEAFSAGRDTALPYPVVCGHQVHGCAVAIVDRPGLTRDDLEGYDALVTRLPGCAVGVRTADCVPVLLYDPAQRAVAAIHAGWKGTVQKIVQRTIRVLQEDCGTHPEDLRAIIGPAIGPDSFQVGPEVVEAFREAGFPMERIWSVRQPVSGRPMSGGHHIDLFQANQWLLAQSGVRDISLMDIDTYTDLRWYSARREGTACGRNIHAIRLV